METAVTNLYTILGVSPSATKTAIKSAFRSLAKKYHPDMNKGDKNSEKNFKEIKKAYETLIDDKKRYEYDKQNGFNQTKAESKTYTNPYQAHANYKKASYNSSAKTSSAQTKNSQETTFREEFNRFVNEVFSAKESNNLPQKGSDIDVEITISIFEAQTGTTRRVNIMHSQTCPNCHGKKFINASKCPKCGGAGSVSSYKTIPVQIPAGTTQGKIIVIKNEGNKGEFGGENGNLNLKINIEKDDFFSFEGLNVLSNIPITPTESALGTTLQIKTIDGLVSMKIPPETSSGQKFRLHSQGIFDKETGKKGDHIVTVFIKMPKNLSLQEKELYNKLAKLRKFNPREE